jgi:hypothetical protein
MERRKEGRNKECRDGSNLRSIILDFCLNLTPSPWFPNYSVGNIPFIPSMVLELSLPVYFLMAYSDCSKLLDHFYQEVFLNCPFISFDQMVISALITTLLDHLNLISF